MTVQNTGFFEGLLALIPKKGRVMLGLSIPIETHAAVESLKLQPDDDFLQVLKDALQTHASVRHAMRSGGQIMVHRGAVVTPLPLNHLNTAEKQRAGWTIISGDKDGDKDK